jgi:saccharopine dehydrogenase-like NADP-dependent oxidoreductase
MMENRINNVLCLGLGKVGTLVATLLSEQFDVTGMDKQAPPYTLTLPFKVVTADVSDLILLEETVRKFDAIVSALPYYLNNSIARLAHKYGKHYFDLTEDVTSTKEIRTLSETATAVMAPQCGLAPGFIGIIAADLAREFDRLRSIEMRVGALPKYPNGALGYSLTWSATGLVNEYVNDAEVIHDGKRKTVTSLQGKERINLEGAPYEAFYTSGGLGTMCETYEGKVKKLDYKTIRYPGHCDLMNFLIHELHLNADRKQLEDILKNAKPVVQDDVVIAYAVVEGWKNGELRRSEFSKSYSPIVINVHTWRAISWTTAASIVAVIEMVSYGWLPEKGFIKQEEIPLLDFLKTKCGSFFK